MDIDFYEIYKLVKAERIRDERIKKENLYFMADKEYNLFHFWARIENNQDYSVASFKKYLQETKREIWGAIKTVIAEKYFGYSKKFNSNKNNYDFYKNRES